MNRNTFNGYLQQSTSLLKHLLLFNRRNHSPDYENVAGVRKLPYAEQWSYYLNNATYDFLLNDWSLIQFELIEDGDEHKYRYVYLECPYQASLTFDEYRNTAKSFVRADQEAEYYSYLEDSCPEKENLRPIRYDYTPRQYRAGAHPASHLHLGRDHEYRISTQKLLNPVSFVLFLGRHIYLGNWVQFIQNQNHTNQYGIHVRAQLRELEGRFRNPEDDLELHLQ